MQVAQEAANSEEKSSMGDKYETGRAMSQLDKDMNAKQMLAFQNELNQLQKINPAVVFAKAQPGALVKTGQGYFLIGAAIGTLLVDGIKVSALSQQSPLADALANKEAGESYTLNGNSYKILEIT